MGDITLEQIISFITLIAVFITNVEVITKRMKSSISKTLKDTLQPVYDKIDAIDKKQQKLETKIDDNEADRIRAEMFHYGSIARTTHCISERDWFHIQAIYKKYREELHKNGEVVHEYEIIQECYDSQFSGRDDSVGSHHTKQK